jgi:hypothetical protein
MSNSHYTGDKGAVCSKQMLFNISYAVNKIGYHFDMHAIHEPNAFFFLLARKEETN